MSDLSQTEGKHFGSGLFDSFRNPPFPCLYGPLKTAVTADVLEAGFLYAIAILAFSFFLVIPGVIFRKRLLFFLKIVLGLFILISIFMCNFGQEWEVAEAEVRTQYKAFTRKEIEAEIKVKIGLRSVNITLKAHDEDSDTVNFGEYNETINYNERFSWDNMGWTQGRAGFGPFAGLINQEFRAGQYRGLPYPILWIAEYFVPDGEGIRWGRFYRQAGYFTHIMLWSAFPLFLLATILIMMVRSYGAIFFIFTGLSMLCGNLCFAFIRNPTQLTIPFEPHHLVFHWGWCFWLCLITGLLNIFLGIAAFVLDFMCPDWLCDFLSIDVTKDYEEFYLSREELENLGIIVPKESKSQPKANGSTAKDTDDSAIYAKSRGTYKKSKQQEYHGYRKRMTKLEERLGTTRIAKNRSMSRYRILNRSTNDSEIKNAVFGRTERERPALPSKMYAGRTPVVPTDANRSVAYTNPAVDFDEVAASGQEQPPSHLNTDPMKQMDNYDNNQGAMSHFRRSKNGRR